MITGEIDVQYKDENTKIEESTDNIDNSKVTDVNFTNSNPDAQDITVSKQHDNKPQNRNQILVRIIELYSDGTFRHYDP